MKYHRPRGTHPRGRFFWRAYHIGEHSMFRSTATELRRRNCICWENEWVAKSPSWSYRSHRNNCARFAVNRLTHWEESIPNARWKKRMNRGFWSCERHEPRSQRSKSPRGRVGKSDVPSAGHSRTWAARSANAGMTSLFDSRSCSTVENDYFNTLPARRSNLRKPNG